MLNQFYWIVEHELAGMALPTAARAYLYLEDADQAAKEEWLREIDDLKSHGIGAVISLTEQPLATDMFRESGILYHHIPVPDMTAPTPSQIVEFVDYVATRVAEDCPSVVHCLSGMGRTGTMAACYLVAKGHPPQEAIAAVRQLRPGSIETHWQEEAIYEYSVMKST